MDLIARPAALTHRRRVRQRTFLRRTGAKAAVILSAGSFDDLVIP